MERSSQAFRDLSDEEIEELVQSLNFLHEASKTSSVRQARQGSCSRVFNCFLPLRRDWIYDVLLRSLRQKSHQAAAVIVPTDSRISPSPV